MGKLLTPRNDASDNVPGELEVDLSIIYEKDTQSKNQKSPGDSDEEEKSGEASK